MSAEASYLIYSQQATHCDCFVEVCFKFTVYAHDVSLQLENTSKIA